MKKYLFFLTALLCLSSCSKKLPRNVIDGFAQGSTYHIVYNSSKDIAKSSVDSLFAVFDRSCSLYDSTSLISRINRNETDSIDDLILRCIEVSGDVYTASGGYFDITVKPLVQAYGFFRDNWEHGTVNRDSLREITGFDKLRIEGNRIIKPKGMQIDLNAVAQGCAADWIGEWLVRQGVTDFLVEVGGEIYCGGDNNGNGWRVGIDRPVDGNNTPGADLQYIVNVSDRGLVTSGNYRKNYTDSDGERINHTFNPLTLETSINEMLSATVIAPTSIEADAYATALMAMGVERGMEMIEKNPGLEAVFVYLKDGKPVSLATPGFEKVVVENNN